MIAHLQKITYEDYLPIILGPNLINRYKLYIDTRRSKYNDQDNAGIANGFSTAGFRFGHSLINGLFQMVSETSKQVVHSFFLSDNFFGIKQFFEFGLTSVDKILAGLITQSSQSFDINMTPELTQKLFKDHKDNFGHDLMARNIHRGRDHGLPGYNMWRQFAKRRMICSWEERPNEISQHKWNILQQIYKHPNDIDVFVAGLAENNVRGGVTGPTFSNILAKQFASLRFGDRFFFTHVGQFTDEQIVQIRTRTLTDIICDNTEIVSTKTNVFMLDSPERSCEDSFDFELDKFF